MPRRATLPVGGCCWPTPHWGRCAIQGQARLSAPLATRVPRPRLPSLCLMLTNFSSLFLSALPLGCPAFLVTFGILLNTCDLWPLPSGLSTHLSPQLLPLLNSVRLAPPPVIKRRTFQVDTFPLPRPHMASCPRGSAMGYRQSQNLTLLQ